LRVIEYDKDDENWGSALKDKITASLEVSLDDPSLAVPTTFLENAAEARFSTDPLSLQLRQINDELRALRTSISTKSPAAGEAQRLMTLLDRHSTLLQSAPETARLAIFQDLLRGDISAAIERVQRSLDIPRVQ